MPEVAEKPAKPLPPLPDGCIRGFAPDGETPIVIKAPRGPGPWFRVHHELYGARLIHAKDADEAVQKFAEEFAPGNAGNKEWMKQLRAQCRIGRLPEPGAPAPVPAPAG